MMVSLQADHAPETSLHLPVLDYDYLDHPSRSLCSSSCTLYCTYDSMTIFASLFDAYSHISSLIWMAKIYSYSVIDSETLFVSLCPYHALWCLYLITALQTYY